MYCLARTHFVNRSPLGEYLEPLTPSQLFEALKLEERQEIMSHMEQCEVISENETVFVREFKFKDSSGRVRLRTEYFEPMIAEHTMLSLAGDTMARMTEIISTTPDGEMLLTLVLAVESDDVVTDEYAKGLVAEEDASIAGMINMARAIVKGDKM